MIPARFLAWPLAALLAGAIAGVTRADETADPSRAVAASEAAAAEPAALEAYSGVAVQVLRAKEGVEVEARCRIEASREAAWRVLTDYDGIDRFVSSMKESRVSGRGDGFVLVDQVAIGRLFLFTRRMRATLRVHEEPPARIRFEDVLHRDFVIYQGEWRIEQHGNRTEIVYRVGARPAFAVPDLVVREVLRRTVRDLISQVGAEIERREAVATR